MAHKPGHNYKILNLSNQELEGARANINVVASNSFNPKKQKDNISMILTNINNVITSDKFWRMGYLNPNQGYGQSGPEPKTLIQAPNWSNKKAFGVVITKALFDARDVYLFINNPKLRPILNYNWKTNNQSITDSLRSNQITKNQKDTDITQFEKRTIQTFGTETGRNYGLVTNEKSKFFNESANIPKDNQRYYSAWELFAWWVFPNNSFLSTGRELFPYFDRNQNKMIVGIDKIYPFQVSNSISNIIPFQIARTDYTDGEDDKFREPLSITWNSSTDPSIQNIRQQLRDTYVKTFRQIFNYMYGYIYTYQLESPNPNTQSGTYNRYIPQGQRYRMLTALANEMVYGIQFFDIINGRFIPPSSLKPLSPSN
jgi:hypothetical protein